MSRAVLIAVKPELAWVSAVRDHDHDTITSAADRNGLGHR
jgi:hypothetical protein